MQSLKRLSDTFGQTPKRPRLVRNHKAGIADHVGGKYGGNHVMALTGQQHETDQASQGIHQGDDLGGQASSRSPDGLILSPPLAPLAFW